MTGIDAGYAVDFERGMLAGVLKVAEEHCINTTVFHEDLGIALLSS